VHIKYEWLSFLLVNAFETLSYQWIGEKSKVAAAGDWEIGAK
jgi:hypothetical protein